MDKQPLVSVAICTYNGEKYLSQQLDSIFKQDYPNFEVIAVDDCSTDQSSTILDNYAREYPNMKIYYNDINLGYVKNFEKAIMLCNGEYIALSDHDDVWHSEKISKQVGAIPGNLMVYHDSQYIDEHGKELNIKMSEILNLRDWDSPIPFFLKNCVSGHTILFHRSLIEHALPLDKNFFHDWWLAFVAANLGSIKYIPLTLVRYRQHVNNTIDMLQRNDNSIKKEQAPNPLLVNKEWILHCSKYNGDFKDYLANLYRLINSRHSFFKRINLFLLLNKYRDELLAISKEPARRNAKKIRNMVFKLKQG
jgi:glycosyltransferase involved in cell wall biosynthesis